MAVADASRICTRAASGAEFGTTAHRCRGTTSRGRTAARTVHTTLAYLCFYVYYRSACACYYILLFVGGFCLHCGKVVSQVLPAIKTRATTVATAAPRPLCVSHNPYIYKFARIHCTVYSCRHRCSLCCHCRRRRCCCCDGCFRRLRQRRRDALDVEKFWYSRGGRASRCVRARHLHVHPMIKCEYRNFSRFYTANSDRYRVC